MTLAQHPTLEEFLQWPEEKPYREYVFGWVREKTTGDNLHSFLQNEIGYLLRGWTGQEGVVATEQRCILRVADERHVVLPDVAWFSQQQMPTLVRGPVYVSPTLAVEILSPDDRFSDVEDKIQVYLGAGVGVVWVVDPKGKHVTSYRADRAPERLNPPAVLSDTLLPGLVISLADLFARLPEG
ncbi:MAG TPA: Uma2 family endonuclease [Candidatus Xenobia bacterium]|jgi:Uma2 family endonuclease